MQASTVLLSLAISVCLAQRLGDNLLDYASHKRQCTKITLELCKDIGYNKTAFPNRFAHEDQQEAGLEANQFMPLIQVNCAPHLKFLLCSLYVPFCQDNYDKEVLPCRGVCEEVRAGCEPKMASFGFRWPKNLECKDLPERGDPHQLCMGPPDHHVHTTPPPTLSLDNNQLDPWQRRPVTPDNIYVGHAPDKCSCRCQAPFVKTIGTQYSDRSVQGVTECSYSCRSPYLYQVDALSGHVVDNPQREHFTSTWIGFWAISCLAITVVTVFTFLIDTTRFQYPERPIFYLAACYLFVAAAYIVRLVVGHKQLACTSGCVAGCIVKQAPTLGDLCTLVALLEYFFGMASCVWWVLLCFTWYLAAGLKWAQEAIGTYSIYYHLLAWGVPLVQCIIVLALGAIDGDSLSGMCSVANTNLTHLRALVIAPRIAYLLLGACFLLAGFVSLIRIHATIKQQQRAHYANDWGVVRLQHLIVKLGIFSLLYTLPAATLIACFLYEQHYRDVWERSIVCPCEAKTTTNTATTVFVLALIKYASTLVIGVTSGLWICSSKTLHSWHMALCCRCCAPSHNDTIAETKGYHITPTYDLHSNETTTPQPHMHTDASSNANSHTYTAASIAHHNMRATHTNALHAYAYAHQYTTPQHLNMQQRLIYHAPSPVQM